MAKRGKEINYKIKPSLFIGLLVLFIVGLLALNFVTVGQGITGHASDELEGAVIPELYENQGSSSGGDGLIYNLFADWTAGNMDINIAKYLLFGILTLLIYSALAFAKFPDNTALQWLVAIPVSFLATAYLAPATILAILISYSGLGVTISIALPFVILLFFSAMLLSNEKLSRMSVGKVLFQIVLWMVWGVYLCYRLIYFITIGGGFPSGTGEGGVLTYPLVILLFVLLLTIFIVVFNKRFRRWIWSLGRDLIAERGETQEALIEARRQVGGALSGISVTPQKGKHMSKGEAEAWFSGVEWGQGPK